MKKLVSTLLALVCVLTFSFSAFAASPASAPTPQEIQPRWIEVGDINNTLRVTGTTGRITAAVTLGSTDYVAMTVELQRYTGRWETIEEWDSITGQGGCGLTATRALLPGYQYRVYLTITVTDDVDGHLIETVYSKSNTPFVS